VVGESSAASSQRGLERGLRAQVRETITPPCRSGSPPRPHTVVPQRIPPRRCLHCRSRRCSWLRPPPPPARSVGSLQNGICVCKCILWVFPMINRPFCTMNRYVFHLYSSGITLQGDIPQHKVSPCATVLYCAPNPQYYKFRRMIRDSIARRNARLAGRVAQTVGVFTLRRESEDSCRWSEEWMLK
jgi:hypothetical protein